MDTVNWKFFPTAHGGTYKLEKIQHSGERLLRYFWKRGNIIKRMCWNRILRFCHGNEKRCKAGRGIYFSFQNWHEAFDEFWPKHLKISKISTIMGCLWPKYIMFELRKYRGVMFDGNEYWYKIWRKIDFCFQSWHEKFGKLSPEHLKVSKLGIW